MNVVDRIKQMTDEELDKLIILLKLNQSVFPELITALESVLKFHQ